MTEAVRKRTAAGHVQTYHVGSSAVSNPVARDAFNPRPARATSGLEHCASYEFAVTAYKKGALGYHIELRDLAKEEGLGRSPLDVAEDLERRVHEAVFAEFGDPSTMPSFAAAVEMRRSTAFDQGDRENFIGASRRVGFELLAAAGRKQPGPHFFNAMHQAVSDAADAE